jgi:hypothetical protein
MSFTIWSKPWGSREWTHSGLQIDSEKLASQSFDMYPIAPGEMIQLRDPEGVVIDERIDMSRPHDPASGPTSGRRLGGAGAS